MLLTKFKFGLTLFLLFASIFLACKKDIEKKTSDSKIISITLKEAVDSAIIIDSINFVLLRISKNANLSKLCPNIIVSDKASIYPSSKDTVDFSSGYRNYKIISEDNSVSNWLVEVKVIDSIKKNDTLAKLPHPDTIIKKDLIFEPDTTLVAGEHLDLKKWENFISSIASNDSIIFVPLKDYGSTYNPTKIIIALRHDIDNSIRMAVRMAEIENKYGVVGTYYVLQTADYYVKKPLINMSHNDSILSYIYQLQNKYHQEVGIHNDLVTLQVIYGINTLEYLREELAWLRHNGIEIYGTAAHGSPYAERYKYLNLYFFKERSEIQKPYVNNESVSVNEKKFSILKGTFEEYDLKYEAYDYVENYADRPHVGQWDPNLIVKWKKWKKGDKVLILVHPY